MPRALCFFLLASAAAQTAAASDTTAPVIEHTPVTSAPEHQAFRIEARVADPSGVFDPPAVYLRNSGGRDFIPLRMDPVSNKAELFSAEVPASLVTTSLEYYIEAYDLLGNGPAQSGNPNHPHFIAVEKPVAPKKINPPAVVHVAITSAVRGHSVPLEAKFASDSGISHAAVMFRHVGAADYSALPMMDDGNGRYLAELPAALITGDFEYYVEVYDSTGAFPGRSGAASAPYRVAVESEAVVGRLPPTGQDTGVSLPAHPRVRPFRPFLGEAAAWTMLATGVGLTIFASGEALGGYRASDAYHAQLDHEGVNNRDMLGLANAYAKRSEVFAGIAAGCYILGGVLLGVVESAHDKELARLEAQEARGARP